MPKLGLPIKYPLRVIDKQSGNVGGIIETHNMEDGGDSGYLAEPTMSFTIPS